MENIRRVFFFCFSKGCNILSFFEVFWVEFINEKWTKKELLNNQMSFWDSFWRNIFSRFSNCRIFFFPSSISACSSSRVFSFGFVMVGRSFLLIGIEKGQSIFSAALLGGY